MIKKGSLLLLLSFLLLSCYLEKEDNTTMVLMLDGVKLSTQILFPKEQQDQYPVVLVRTPYNKERRIDEYSYLVDNGYVLVVQDVRGRFGSEGTFEPFINERKDGYDTIEWINRQNWCNGNIGMIGASYNGYVQYCAATEQPTNLKAIIPNIAMVDPFYSGPYLHGIFSAGSLQWCAIIEQLGSDEEIFNMDWVQLLNHLPVSELDSKIFSRKLDYYQKWVQHDSQDDYWKQAFYLEELRKIKIPVFIQSGWFDSQLLGSKIAYEGLTKAGNKNVKMIIGPWGHTDEESTSFKNQFMGEAADDINLQAEYLRWFDYWLKGIDNGIMNEPMIQLYAMNENKWHSDDNYPLSSTITKKLFISNDSISKKGKLVFDADHINEGSETFVYDPGNTAVFTNDMYNQIRDNNFGFFEDLLTRCKDYLLYTTTELEEETILGQISAKIFASSSAVDTDWVTALLILNDKNKVINMIGFDALRAKYRNSFEKSELLERNKIYSYEMDMNFYGLKLDKGQKIGLFITSSFGYPFLTKNLNTGENNLLNTNFEIATQKIYHTKENSSYISLQILNN